MNKGLNVLSLFNGISCGRIALDRGGCDVNKYISYEIDKTANKIAKYHYPNDEYCGDVKTADFTQYKGFDLLIGGSPCFVKDTMVLTRKGVMPIQDIRIGDEVYTHNNRWRKVTNVGNKFSKIVRLKTQGVYETITTLNHPYYCRNVERKIINDKNKRVLSEPLWTEVKDMTKSTYVSSPILKTEENIYNLTPEQCWILGRYIADGYIRKDKRKNRINSYQYGVILSIGNNKVDYVKSKIQTYHYSCYPHSKGVHRIVISNMNLVNFILNNDFGTDAANKNIPIFILNLPNNLLKEFLDGYLSGDAHYDRLTDTYSATTISRRLAFSLALAVQKSFKVNTSIFYSDKRKTFIIEDRIVNAQPIYIVNFKSTLKEQTHALVLDDNKIYLPFKGIKELEEDIVYNLSVYEDESYVANNLIVHNCTNFSISKTHKAKIKKERHINEGDGWNLFLEYVRALHESQPKYFLYENNYRIPKEIEYNITKLLGVKPVLINSALVSAQNRKRLYWTNIPNVTQPEDKHIYIKDIYVPDKTLERVDKRILKSARWCRNYIQYSVNDKHSTSQAFRLYFMDGKAPTQARCRTESKCNILLDKNDISRYKIISPLECERLQTLPDGYTDIGIPKTKRFEAIGNGWTVDVIAHIFKEL